MTTLIIVRERLRITSANLVVSHRVTLDVEIKLICASVQGRFVVFLSDKEASGVESHFELGRYSQKNSTYHFLDPVPSELDCQNVVVGVRLGFVVATGFNIAAVIDVSFLLFKIKHDPVMEPRDAALFHFADKDMFKARRIRRATPAIHVEPNLVEELHESLEIGRYIIRLVSVAILVAKLHGGRLHDCSKKVPHLLAFGISDIFGRAGLGNVIVKQGAKGLVGRTAKHGSANASKERILCTIVLLIRFLAFLNVEDVVLVGNEAVCVQVPKMLHSLFNRGIHSNGFDTDALWYLHLECVRLGSVRYRRKGGEKRQTLTDVGRPFLQDSNDNKRT